MEAKQLIGKLAISTKRTKKTNDGSYTTNPIFILIATDSHIEYRSSLFGGDVYVGIMGIEFCDDNWIDFEENFSNESKEKYKYLKTGGKE